MSPITSLTITYDSDCGFCTSARDWIQRQVPLVSLEFLAMRSPAARKRLPQLRDDELAVIANTGEAWFGNHAWIVCLWALRDYRGLALRLASPLLSLMAREAYSLVAKNRLALSGLLQLKSDRELEQQLRSVHVSQCATQKN